MNKRSIFLIFFLVSSILFLTQASFALAKTSGEYVDDAYGFIEQGKFDEAFTVIRAGLQEYPGDIGLVFALAETQHNTKDYESAIANYLSILDGIRRQGQGKEAPAQLHWNLVDAYNKLGQQHYFPQELSLRIIYHDEKYLELEPNPPSKDQGMEFLRKSIGHYDVAGLGKGNVQMMEEGGDGAEFNLPEDNISQEEKFLYKDKAIQRLKEYDEAKKQSLYAAVPSDKTPEEIISLFDTKIKSMISINFKLINTYAGKEDLLEEVYYKSPDKFKAVQPNDITVMRDNIYYVIDPQTNKIKDQMPMSIPEVDAFRSLAIPNLKFLSKYYTLGIEKISGAPDFLKEAYSGTTGIYPNLYVVTATLKDENNCPFFPPIQKFEYFIDVDLGLTLCTREYWLGVLGSGKKEDLAKEKIVKTIQKIDNLYMPSEGTTRGQVSELSDLKEDWRLDIISMNGNIDDNVFQVNN